MNISNTSALNNTQTNFTISGIPNGLYIWSAEVTDTGGKLLVNTTNYTFTIDSCTYVSVAWTILSSDNCVLLTDTDIGSNFLIFSGSDGLTTINATIQAGKIRIDQGARVLLKQGKLLIAKQG